MITKEERILMDDQVLTCPNCQTKIPLSEAIKHQIEDSVLKAEREQHSQQMTKALEETKERTRASMAEQYQVSLRSAKEDAAEQRKLNETLQEQLIEMNKQLRGLRQERDEQKLEMERQLTIRQDQAREEAKKQFAEEFRFKDMEKDKKLQDALRMNDELKRKLEQGSQQTQGDVLEHELETRLKEDFPCDEITEVRTGQRGADIKQSVMNPGGNQCGLILWETKNGKWQPNWVTKFKQDVRQANANIGVLVASQTPEDVGDLKHIKGNIWVVKPALATRLAVALRSTLVQIEGIQRSVTSKDERMEVLYTYLIGPEFKHRIEAIVESYSLLQAQMEQEKRWYAKKWAHEEKAIRSVIDNTIGMYGDLQGVTNRALPAIKQLELPEPLENSVQNEDIDAGSEVS